MGSGKWIPYFDLIARAAFVLPIKFYLFIPSIFILLILYSILNLTVGGRASRWVGLSGVLGLKSSTGCKETALLPGTSPPLVSSQTLVSAELSLSCVFTPSSCCWVYVYTFFIFFKVCCCRATTTIRGQPQDHLGTGWTWFFWTWGKFLAASHWSHAYIPPAIKTWPFKPEA